MPRVYDPERYKQYQARRHPRKNQHIIGLDGEGISDPDGKHRYIILASSERTSIRGYDLSSVECFDYLLSLPKQALKVGYSFNYDINMMLRDLSEEALQSLADDGETEWNQYHIYWIPSKKFTVRCGRISTTVWDVFGFFQCSFVKALKNWNVTDEQTIERISNMKLQRDTFTDEQEQEILEYCYSECNLLVQIVNELLQCCESVDLQLTSYHGAGSIAAAILKRENISEYLCPPPKPVFDASLYAYFGGRFDSRVVGYVEGPIYSYDIRSAYPYQISKLPCLRHGEWEHVNSIRSFTPDTYAICHVRFRWQGMDNIWPALPFRDKNNGIRFPSFGEGWYWWHEVYAAMQNGDPDTSFIEVVEAWKFNRQCEHQPFLFVPELYRQRAQLKQEGNFGQIVLKLGLNSLYGKMAQSIGSGKHKPTYQSYLWAGMITSGTRSMLLQTMRYDPATVISVATDGILTTKKLNLPLENELGSWETTEPYDACFIAQPGVYQLKRNGEWVVNKTRGFTIKELSFDVLRDAFFADGWKAKVAMNITRFNGLAISRHAPNAYPWRRWTERQKVVSFRPQARIPYECYNLDQEFWSQGGTSYFDLMAVSPTPWESETADFPMSSPYKLKSNWDDMWDDPYLLPLLVQLDQPELLT